MDQNTEKKMDEENLFFDVCIPGFKAFYHEPNTVEITILQGRWLTTITNAEFQTQFAKMIGCQETEFKRVYNYGEVNVWFATLGSRKIYESLMLTEFYEPKTLANERTQRLIRVSVTHVDKKNCVKGTLRCVPPHISKVELETALQGLCEEGTAPNIKTEDKGNNYKFIVKPKMEKDKIPHFIRFKDAEGAAQVAVIQKEECCAPIAKLTGTTPPCAINCMLDSWTAFKRRMESM